MTHEPTVKQHVQRDYRGDSIVVHWDSASCIHSENCLHALPAVFDVRRRPWIRVDTAGADEIATAVDTCPSKALTYTRLDGVAEGPNGIGDGIRVDTSAPAETTVVIALKPDGPLVVEGPVHIELARGETLEVTDRTVLCRCGGSETKPYCDGTHKHNDFHAAGW